MSSTCTCQIQKLPSRKQPLRSTKPTGKDISKRHVLNSLLLSKPTSSPVPPYPPCMDPYHWNKLTSPSSTQLGLANYTAAEIDAWMHICTSAGYVKPTVYQGQYNMLCRRPEEDLFPTLRRHGIVFNAYRYVNLEFFPSIWPLGRKPHIYI